MNQEDQKKVDRWFADGKTWVGVFENKDLGHQNQGHRIGLPFDIARKSTAVLNHSHAPDGSYGLGWRYILVAKCTTTQEVIDNLKERNRDGD